MDAKTPRRLLRNDLDRFRLRTYLEELIGTDELEIVEEPVELSDVAAKLHGNRKAVWFKKPGDLQLGLVGNVVGSRSRLARAFGVAPNKLLDEIQRRLKLEPELIELEQNEAPVQEVVLTGADADLTKLPAHLQHAYDGAPYISASIDYCVDPRNGMTNSGMRRIMLRGPHEAGIDLNAPSDLRAIYQAAVARGEKLPVSFVVGAHPIDTLSATMKIPVDELGLVGSLRGGTLPVVKCRTNDIRVPADAELVIEGYLDEKGYSEKEGPYGEYLGYYGVVKQNPVFHVTAITHRKDAVFQTATISGGHMDMTDTSNLEALRTELNVWRALRNGRARAGRGLRAGLRRRLDERALLAAPALSRRGTQRALHRARLRSAPRTCSPSTTTSTSSTTSRWNGRSARAFSPTATSCWSPACAPARSIRRCTASQPARAPATT